MVVGRSALYTCKALAAAALLALAPLAFAEPCAWVAVTVASKHIGAKPGANYNESNLGLGSEHCIGSAFGTELRGVAGFFRNSNRVDSFYFGGSATLLEIGPARVGVALVQVSGYQIDPIPAVFPVVAFEGNRLGANVSYFPKTGSTVSAVGLQLKWRFR